MTTADSRVLVDTNVLLSASTPARRDSRALSVMNEWPNRGLRLCTSGQILREYLVVATRPSDRNGLSLSAAHALRNADAFRKRMLFLEETRAVFERVRTLMLDVHFTGKQVHDANVVATALTHGVSRVVTANVAHYRRFKKLVDIVGL